MLPVALQQAINMGVNMMDTMMLGSFGEIQLSASSLANQYYNFFTILCMGIIGGSSVLAAQYWGAGEKEKVRETFNMALRLSAGVAVLFMILTWIFPGPIMSIYTSEEEVIVQGIRYLKITAFIFVIHGTSLVAAQLMRSVGQAHLGLIVSIISFVVNIGANYIFIFGKFGLPEMGAAGAAVGSSRAANGWRDNSNTACADATGLPGHEVRSQVFTGVQCVAGWTSKGGRDERRTLAAVNVYAVIHTDIDGFIGSGSAE